MSATTMTNDTRLPPQAAILGTAIFVVGITTMVLVTAPWREPEVVRTYSFWGIMIGIIFLAWLAVNSLKVAEQWERAVVLRFGAYKGLRGPGCFFIIPILEYISHHVDQRIRARQFGAETTLTRDTVPVDVDAIFFFVIWDAEKSVLEVERYEDAIMYSAQTALRDIIGKHELADILQNRKELGQTLQEILDAKTHDWGITIQSVEIRDITIPKQLEQAMSKEAQAERERRARIILGTAETEIAEKFATAAQRYRDNPVALHLRGMNMLFEGLKEKGSMVIVPSSALETMNLGAQLGTTALAAQTPAPTQSSD
ncbi:MAG: slipin family protein [Phycisphaerales bacterium]|nr:MAG: slipin family protein [Phycisphaerales bacterium]